MRKSTNYFIINSRNEIFKNSKRDQNGSIIINKQEQISYQVKKNISLTSLELKIVKHSFVIDKCNILFVIDFSEPCIPLGGRSKSKKNVVKMDLDKNNFERIPCTFMNPKSVCVNNKNIYVLDEYFPNDRTSLYRIYFISKTNYQIFKVVESDKVLFRILYNGTNDSLILVEWKPGKNNINSIIISEISANTGEQLKEHTATPIPLRKYPKDLKLHLNLKLSKGLTVSVYDFLYVLDVGSDLGESWIQIYDLKNNYIYKELDISPYNKDKRSKPSSLDTDSEGNIYIVYEKPADKTSYAFPVKIPVSEYIIPSQKILVSNSFIKNYSGQSDMIFIDRENKLSNDIYLINFKQESDPSEIKNVIILGTKYYYKSEEEIGDTLTVDSMEENTRWSDISFDCVIESKTAIIISYYASNKMEDATDIRKWGNKIYIDNDNTKNFPLVYPSIGKYLYIQIIFISQDPNNTPRLREFKVSYSNNSYLKYLPQIYQENEISKRFLENFLGLFKIMFDNIDYKISSFTKYLDDSSVPENFLHWLASWISLSYDESWNPHSIRIFLQRAPQLYKMRGTKEGILEIISIYAYNNLKNNYEKLLLTCSESNLKRNEMHLCNISIDVKRISHLLYSVVWIFEPNNPLLVDDRNSKKTFEDESKENPYIFYVILHPILVKNSLIEGIKKIIEIEKPAHTFAKICTINPCFYLGLKTYLGVNTIVGKRNKFTVGISKLGVDKIIDTKDDRWQIETRSRLNIDTVLS